MTIHDIISAHPTTCGVDLLTVAYEALGGTLTPAEDHAIFEARPDCGIACEDECPHTGQPARWA